jgi:CRISPR-associated protein Csx14
MPEFTIPVDLRNPGQVFACLGLMEAAETLLKTSCEGQFDYLGRESNTTFTLFAGCGRNPIEAVVDFLATCRVFSIAPRESDELTTARWGVPTTRLSGHAFPAPAPKTPATLPAILEADGRRLVLDHWIDGAHSGRDNVKFWAGAGGYPGAALARDALVLIAELTRVERDAARTNPFTLSKPMTSSFRLDWRRDYIPLDAGFSPNVTGVKMVGYPLTELLAALGLQNARPARLRDKLSYRYGVSSARLPVTFTRGILGAAEIGFPMRTFHMSLGWPGQEGQARCIVDAFEENVS